jgi:hypothetical protein
MRCCCEEAGALRSGVRGIVAGPADKSGRRIVERCDVCLRFPSDEAAGLWLVTVKGGVARYDKSKVVWSPCRESRTARSAS